MRPRFVVWGFILLKFLSIAVLWCTSCLRTHYLQEETEIEARYFKPGEYQGFEDQIEAFQREVFPENDSSWYLDYISNGHCIFLLKGRKKDIIGLAHLRPRPSAVAEGWKIFPELCGYIGSFGIVESEQGKGYGRELLSLIIEYAQAEFGVRRVELEVRANNPQAYNLYLTHGFTGAILNRQYYSPRPKESFLQDFRIDGIHMEYLIE